MSMKFRSGSPMADFESESLTGKIVKGIGGFYYVYVPDAGVFECRAKGVFRAKDVKPLVGDECVITVLDPEKKLGNLVEIKPRKNKLLRPEVANVDLGLVIMALTKPEPNYNLLDRMLIHLESRNLPSFICFNKEDLSSEKEIKTVREAYEASGSRVVIVSAKEKTGLEEMKSILAGKTVTVAGPSGVGKSTIINELLGDERMLTGDISEHIGRGKHTTRHSELFAVEINGEPTYLLDTPGFSSLMIPETEERSIASFYHEFDEYEKYCRFGDCAHIKESDCGVKDAVKKGLISSLRYENYVRLYEEEKSSRKY